MRGGYRTIIFIVSIPVTVILIVVALVTHKDSGSPSSVIQPPTPSGVPTAGVNMFERRNLAPAVAAMRAKAGPGAPLVRAIVTEGQVAFTLRKGRTQQAEGYRWTAGQSALDRVTVTVVGTGDIEHDVFPLRTLRPGVPQRLLAAVRRKLHDPKATVTAMNLTLRPVQHVPYWAIVASGNGRLVTIAARPDGTHLETLG